MHAALLRAVNLGPHGKIAMSDLKDLATAAGLSSVKTLLASGNLVFESKKTGSALEKLLEKELAAKHSLSTSVMVRSSEELAAIVEANPYPAMAKKDPGHLVVVFMKSSPSPAALEELRGAIKGKETVELVGKNLYACYPDGIGRSKLTAALIDKKLGCAGTGRNWNTVLKLVAAVGGGDD